jgi:hypothetical protein
MEKKNVCGTAIQMIKGIRVALGIAYLTRTIFTRRRKITRRSSTTALSIVPYKR